MPLFVVGGSGHGCPGAPCAVTCGISVDMGQMWCLGLSPRDPFLRLYPMLCMHVISERTWGISFKKDHGRRLSLGYSGGEICFDMIRMEITHGCLLPRWAVASRESLSSGLWLLPAQLGGGAHVSVQGAQ